jgi:hypothetical protein
VSWSLEPHPVLPLLGEGIEPLPVPPLLGEGVEPLSNSPLLGERAFDQMLVVAYTSATISYLCKSGTTLKQTIPLIGGL